MNPELVLPWLALLWPLWLRRRPEASCPIWMRRSLLLLLALLMLTVTPKPAMDRN